MAVRVQNLRQKAQTDEERAEDIELQGRNEIRNVQLVRKKSNLSALEAAAFSKRPASSELRS